MKDPHEGAGAPGGGVSREKGDHASPAERGAPKGTGRKGPAWTAPPQGAAVAQPGDKKPRRRRRKRGRKVFAHDTAGRSTPPAGADGGAGAHDAAAESGVREHTVEEARALSGSAHAGAQGGHRAEGAAQVSGSRNDALVRGGPLIDPSPGAGSSWSGRGSGASSRHSNDADRVNGSDRRRPPAETVPSAAQQATGTVNRQASSSEAGYAKTGPSLGGGDKGAKSAGHNGTSAHWRPPLTQAQTGQTHPVRPSDLPVYAALDLGTNNCRLLVAVPTRPGQFRVIDAFSRIVRLGEGLTSSGRLSDAAMNRAVDALAICANKLGQRRIDRARLIATEACRSAENGQEFLDRVEERTGLQLEIIDRETEARLAVSGCGTLVERETEGLVLFDIGGGSSEIALVDLTRQRTPRLANHIVAWTSLPIGVVSLAEKFGGRDVTPEIFAAMVDHVSAMLDAFPGRDRLKHVAGRGSFHLLGTSGTVTTLAGVHLELDRYDRRRVDGLWMDSANVDAMVARLLSWDFAARVANPCIGADRADLVLAGCAILEAIRRHWPSERLRVADRGLREGMLSELMADDGAWRRSRRRGARPS